MTETVVALFLFLHNLWFLLLRDMNWLNNYWLRKMEIKIVERKRMREKDGWTMKKRRSEASLVVSTEQNSIFDTNVISSISDNTVAMYYRSFRACILGMSDAIGCVMMPVKIRSRWTRITVIFEHIFSLSSSASGIDYQMQKYLLACQTFLILSLVADLSFHARWLSFSICIYYVWTRRLSNISHSIEPRTIQCCIRSNLFWCRGLQTPIKSTHKKWNEIV